MLAVVYSLSSGYAHNACLQPAPRLAATSRSAVMPIRVASVSMQIAGQVACEVRKLPKSSVALDITVPADISNKVHQAVLTELGKNANVPGFRKGKAPPEALLNHVGTHKVKKATVEVLKKIHSLGELRVRLGVLLVNDTPNLRHSFNTVKSVF